MTSLMGQIPKVRVQNPVVDMDGDEMTRVIWNAIKQRLILPLFDIDTLYYDLGLPNRDKTEDAVTQEAVQSVLKHGRGSLLMARFVKPIVIARHAFGDQYDAKDEQIDEAGILSMVFRPKNGAPPREIEIFEFPASGGVAMAQYNTTESITEFAVSCFNFALQREYPLYFCSKSSILTKYDGRFQSIFQEIFDREFRTRFEEKGLFYEHRLNDEMLAYMYKMEGNIVVAMKNYDGDLQSDALAQAYGSAALMTSALVSGDGLTFVSEAAHGTVTKHYYAHLRGEKTSTNPIACIFAWTQALIKRGTLDATPDVVSVAKMIEQATIDTVGKDAIFTKDIALLYKDSRKDRYVTTDEFLDAIQRKVYDQIHNR
ncbi:hypothetical protein ABKA04_005801 [Annulohypoxylon sp. FPYF3050]